MADKKKKDRIFGIIATILAHSLLLLCLIFWGFITPLPLPEERGVIIDVIGGGGGGSSSSVENDNSQEESIENPSNNMEDYATQNSQESVNMNTNNNSSNNTTPIPDQRITNFWNSSNNGQGSGNGTGNGSGSGTGNGTGTGSGTGSGNGSGNGPGYSLHGRTSKSIPLPSYTEEAQGKVVVAIWVDKKGNVVKAVPGMTGTTTSNKVLWQKAQNAALKAKFSVSADAPPEQKGTITYNFIKFN